MLRPSIPSRPVLSLAASLSLAAALSTTPAQAGPTLAADLDLGAAAGRDGVTLTSMPGGSTGFGMPTQQVNVFHYPRSAFSGLYVAGFRLRAGWRFDVGPGLFLLPELGGGCDFERFVDDPPSPVPRFFGGLRAGISFPQASPVRFEPAVYGHVGYAHVAAVPDVGVSAANGLATDVGLSLDVRVSRFYGGLHLGYEVVTAWVPTPVMGNGLPSSPASVSLADGWVGYGLHAGVLFW